MANPYFTQSGVPTQRSNGVSSVIRQEIANIALAFDKLPAFAGNLGKIVIIGASALTPSAAITETAGNIALSGNLTVAGTLQVNGNTALGDAATDTLTVATSLIRGANGNWTLPAAASGDTLNVAALAGNFGVVQAQAMAGSVAKWQLRNTSNAASSVAQFSVEVGGTAAGDPIYQAVVTGGSTWTFGVDNSDSDRFKISASAGLGTGDAFAITTNRNVELYAPVSGATLAVPALPSGVAQTFSDGTVAGAVRFDATTFAIGSTSNHTTAIWANAAARVTISGSGNVAINAPSSGMSLSIAQVDGDIGVQAVATGTSYLRSRSNTSGDAYLSLLTTGVFDHQFRSTRATGSLDIIRDATVLASFDSAFALNLPNANQSLNFTNTGASLSQINAYGASGLELVTRHASASIAVYYGNAAAIGLGIKSDGRVYGQRMHNVGSLGGTTDQFFGSGDGYSPTITNGANVASSTINSNPWMFTRLGNVVTFSGYLSVTPTAGGNTQTVVGVSLPIASNFTTPGGSDLNAIGVPAASSGTITAGQGVPDSTSDNMSFQFYAQSTSAHAFRIVGQYILKA